MAAEDNLMFILNWLEEFPQYKETPLFLTGESYAGNSETYFRWFAYANAEADDSDLNLKT